MAEDIHFYEDEFNVNEEYLEPEDFLPSEGFLHVKDINNEWYSPFRTYKKEYRSFDDGSKALADFMNDKANKEWSIWNCDNALAVRESKDAAGEIGPLPPGIYTHTKTNGVLPERLTTMTFKDEETIIDIGDTFEKVRKDITSFREREHIYKEINTSYKLGLLLYGPPGNGKTILVRKLVEEAVAQGAVVIYVDVCDSAPSSLFLKKIDTLLKDTLKIFVFEELTANLTSQFVTWLLNFLDGTNSVGRSINIATTNYPEVLPMNIVNRPSRFDEIYEFGNPSASEAKKLFTHFMGKPPTPEEATLIKGMSIAAIKQFCLFVRVNELSPVEAKKRLDDRKSKCEKQFQKHSDVGFGFA